MLLSPVNSSKRQAPAQSLSIALISCEPSPRLLRPWLQLRNVGEPRICTDSSRLPYTHILYMVRHMKTTLNIDDQVMARLRREAARQKTTMSDLVETALRGLFARRPAAEVLPPLPRFNAGRSRVDVADREALYLLMDER